MIPPNIQAPSAQPAQQSVLFAPRHAQPAEVSCFQRLLECLKACCCSSSQQRRQVRPAVQHQGAAPPLQQIVPQAYIPQAYIPPAEISRLASELASGSQHPQHNSQHSQGIKRQASQSQQSGVVSGRASGQPSLSQAAQEKEAN
jgi:hypothetical protein